VSGTTSFIGGGYRNTASASCSTVGGGYCNSSTGTYSTIGGGINNNVSGYYSTIVGGRSNCVTSGGVVVGGKQNVSNGEYSFIGAGCANLASGRCSVVGGGYTNIATGNFSFVGGGKTAYDGFNYIQNNAGGYASVVVGGAGNISSGTTSFIGGGRLNTVLVNGSSIVGGICNKICGYGTYGSYKCGDFIGGGSCNIINTQHNNPYSARCGSVINGGLSNSITSKVYGGVIGGGNYNCLTGDEKSSFSTSIGGGACNKILSSAGSTIGGGGENNICCSYNSFIGGGQCNRISGVIDIYGSLICNFSSIGGGFRNTISGDSSTIGGGQCNTIGGSCSSILGGRCNTISSGFTNSNIIGSNITANRSCTTFVNDLSVCSFTGSSGCNVGISTNGLLIPVAASSGGSGIIITGTGVNSTIRCGVSNAASSCFSAALAGSGNTSSACFSTIVGGQNNSASGSTSFIGGGCNNSVIAFQSTIVGGNRNTICNFTTYLNNYEIIPNFIGGGSCNIIFSNTLEESAVGGSSIMGGQCNKICSTTGWSSISGGLRNVVCSDFSIIGGGRNNTTIGCLSFIGSGEDNITCGLGSTIGGGACNRTNGFRSIVGGGTLNCSCANYSSILGGRLNTVCSVYSSILGGQCNTISSGFTKSNIIGSNITANRTCTTFVNDLSVCSFTGSSGCNVGITTNGLLIPVSPGGGSLPIKLTGQTLTETLWALVGDYYTYYFFSGYITTNCDVSVTPQNASYLTAYNAQILPYVGVASGVATLYSQFPPDENMVVDVVITSTNAGVNTFLLASCGGNTYIGYSTSLVFEPGITVYSDITLTTPLFVDNLAVNVSTDSGGTFINSGYQINNIGVVQNTLIICD
jgi:hypothetical protein